MPALPDNESDRRVAGQGLGIIREHEAKQHMQPIRFKVCKVNVDTNQELAVRYKISAIPALLIFHEGKLVARHDGATPEATLRQELAALHEAARR